MAGSNDPMHIEIDIGLPMSYNYKCVHANKWEEPVSCNGVHGNKCDEPVINDPKLANLIYHTCNIAFVLQLLFFIATAVSCFRANGVSWMTGLVVAMISPIFISVLYGIRLLRDEFIRAYATGPPLNFIPEMGWKLRSFDKWRSLLSSRHRIIVL